MIALERPDGLSGMHETGIAAEILDIAEREAARRGARGVA